MPSRDKQADNQADNQADEARNRIHHALYESLIDKIRDDQYPSTTMMDVVEAGTDDKQLSDYAHALLAKVQADRFPSLDLLRRLRTLAG